MFVGIAVIFFGLMTITCMLYPGAALASLVCVFGLEQWLQSHSSFFAMNSTIVNYAFAMIVVVAFISSLFQGGNPFRRITLTQWTIVAFYALLLMTGIWAIDRTWWKSTMKHAAPYTAVYVFLMPFIYHRSRDFRQAAIGVIVFGGATMALLLFDTQLTEYGRSIEVSAPVVDRYGEFRDKGSPLAIATLGGQIAIFSMFLAWNKGMGRLFGLIRFILVAGGFALVFRSESRGQLVAVVAAIMLLLPFRWPKMGFRAVFGIGFTIAIVGGIIIWAYSFSSLEQRWQTEGFLEAYQSTRIEKSTELMGQWIKQSPMHLVLGTGGGSSWHFINGYPHVIVIQILAEMGIVGLSMILFLVGLTAAAVRNIMLASKDRPDLRAIICLFASACAFQFALSFKQGALSSIYVHFVMPILIARFAGAVKKETSRAAVRRPASQLSSSPGMGNMQWGSA